MQLLILLGLVLLIILLGWGALEVWHWQEDLKREKELVFLQLLMPKKESKEDKEVESEQFSTGKDFKTVIGIMDHLFQSLHSVYNTRLSRYVHGQPFFSVEYAALAGEILFFIACPRRIAHLIEKQITSFYPDAIVD